MKKIRISMNGIDIGTTVSMMRANSIPALLRCDQANVSMRSRNIHAVFTKGYINPCNGCFILIREEDEDMARLIL